MLKPYDDRKELEILKNLYGTPSFNKFVLRVDGPFPPPWSNERVGEIVMVLQNKTKDIWVIRKNHYPAKVFRLPSGGIGQNENIISALKRELKEETNLEITPKRFLEVIRYEFITKSNEKAFFSSYIFHFYPIEEKMIIPDKKQEHISYSSWVTVDNLRTLYQIITRSTKYGKPLDYGKREDWCKFRSIIHGEVYKQLI